MISCLMDGAHKRTVGAKSERVAYVVAKAGFLSRYLSDPLPYFQHNITVN